MSNSEEVLSSIPVNKRATKQQDAHLSENNAQRKRALRVMWNIEKDVLGFKVELEDKPATKRGILFVLSSIYDPLGLTSPFLLKGKQMLQIQCKQRYGWDQEVSQDLKDQWNNWENLPKLEQCQGSRCIKSKHFGNLVDCSLHHFSGASEVRYGMASYTPLINTEENVHCCLLFAKSRVAPLKIMSIPRMELVAATIAVNVSNLLRRELEIPINKKHFWTDSNVVLGYIKNKTKRFKIFVANRTQFIRENTLEEQWHYVNTKDNPADITSRGLSFIDVEKALEWFNGPLFLQKDIKVDVEESEGKVPEHDPEIKVVRVNCIKINSSIIQPLETKVSSWCKLKRIVAYILPFINKIKKRSGASSCKKLKDVLTMDEIQTAERLIIKLTQADAFGLNLECKEKVFSRNIKKLDPFVDDDGLFRVGGRLKNSKLDWRLKHPVALPNKSRVSEMIIDDLHRRVAHARRGITRNKIRNNGYWIVSCNSLVRKILFRCVICRKLRGKLGEQKMGELPIERTQEAAPFSYCGVDYFGPYIIKEKRKELKRCGVMFTCLAARAVHIEVSHSLT